MTNPALTPSAVNGYLKTILEKDQYLSHFKIKGEISNFKYHSNGNMYFNIKDESASINCIMFKSFAKNLEDEFKEGDQVEIDGSIYLYVKSGGYNINVRKMIKSGVGNLFVEYEKLKKEYQLKGFFNQEHKKAIPKYPNAIGVITAKTGAAIQDIITTLKRRYPVAKVIIYSTLVQGANAKEDIAKNIKRANDDKKCDVLIVGRGGGSIEDLWAFNESVVVDAIWNSNIPIISSVGHETDTTLSDYAADARAATPTAAAEIASPSIQELNNMLSSYQHTAVKALQNQFNYSKHKLEMLTNNQYFLDPLLHFKMKVEDVDNKLALGKEQLANKINIFSNTLDNQKILIDNLNPLTILSKGYSVSKLEGQIINSVNKVEVGHEITVQYCDGSIYATVEKKEYHE